MSCPRCNSVLRACENLPLFGHLIAMCYGCAKNKDKAERAGLKATVGCAFGLCNFPAEVADECFRKKSDRLDCKKLTPRPDWMKQHNGRVIRFLCLPGSHQSGTYHMEKKLKSIPMIEGWSRCQSCDIYEQLVGGIRFLDVRLMDYEGDIWLHHNVVTCIRFKEVLTSLHRFITQFPSEIVGLYLTADGKSVDWMGVNACIQETLKDRLIFEHMKDMLIGDLADQGKNVMIFGIPQFAYNWRGLKFRWPNKPWPSELRQDLIETIHDLEGSTSSELFWYKAECTPNAALVTRAIGGVPGVAMVRRSEEKFEFLEDLAAATNSAIYDVIQDLQKIPFNVLSVDFVQDDIIGQIIEVNNCAEVAVAGLDLTMCTSDRDSVFTDNTGTVMSEDHPLMRGSKFIEVRETTM